MFNCERILIYLLTLVASASMASCASSSKLYTQENFCDTYPSEGMSRIVVNRVSSIIGSAVSFRVDDTGQPIGDIVSGDRLCWDRHPGVAWVTVRLTGLGAPKSYSEHGVKIVETLPNQTYELVIVPTMKGPVISEAADS